MGARDLGDAEKGRAGLDHRQHLRRADRDAALGLQFVDDLGDQLDVLRALRLRQGDRMDAGTDHRFEVAHGHAQRPV